MPVTNQPLRIALGTILSGAAVALTAPAIASENTFALHFDGIEGEAVSEASFDVQHLTVEAWVNVESVNLDPCCTFAGIVTWGRDFDASWEFGVVGEPAGGPIETVHPFFKINWGKNDSHELFAPSATIELQTWAHIAATYDGVTARLYVNGQLASEEVFDAPISAGGEGAQMAIGNNFPGGNELFGGTIDEIRVWNIARTPEQIMQTMYRPLVGTDAGLFAYYDLNEGQGNLLTDRSGNGRHATLVTPDPTTGTSWVQSTSPAQLLIGDLDNDGLVNVLDLLQLLASWGACDACIADLNSNDFVDVADLLILLEYWNNDHT